MPIRRDRGSLPVTNYSFSFYFTGYTSVEMLRFAQCIRALLAEGKGHFIKIGQSKTK